MLWHEANIQRANYEEVIYLLQVMDEFSGSFIAQPCVRVMEQKKLCKHVEIREHVLVNLLDRQQISLNSTFKGKKVISENSMLSVITDHYRPDPHI